MAARCQWIKGDPRNARTPGADDMKCAEPVAAIDVPYCARHMARAYVSAREAKAAMREMQQAAGRIGFGKVLGS